SSAITSSTVSSESAPRSSTNEESFLISASFTPSCSAMIFLTRCSMFSIRAPSWVMLAFCAGLVRVESLRRAKRRRILRHIHAAVDVQDRAGHIVARRRCEVGDRGGDVLRGAQAAERNLPEQGLAAVLGQRAGHVGVDE